MKSFFLFLTILLLNNCSGFTPLYKNHSFLNEQLKNITLTSDRKKMSLSVKKNLLQMLPSSKEQINYILKIETLTQTSSTVTASDRKTSGYEVITNAKLFLYKRMKRYDKLVFSFDKKEVTMFELSPNQVLSTLASRNKAFKISSENISKSIFDELMLYFTSKNYVNK